MIYSHQEDISPNISLWNKSEGKVNALSWGKRFDGPLSLWDASLLSVPTSVPISRVKGRAGQLSEQDFEFCWVLPWLESKGWRPGLLSNLSGPINGPAQVITWQGTLVDLLSAPEVPLWLAPSFTPGPHNAKDCDLQVWLQWRSVKGNCPWRFSRLNHFSEISCGWGTPLLKRTWSKEARWGQNRGLWEEAEATREGEQEWGIPDLKPEEEQGLSWMKWKKVWSPRGLPLQSSG